MRLTSVSARSGFTLVEVLVDPFAAAFMQRALLAGVLARFGLQAFAAFGYRKLDLLAFAQDAMTIARD